MTRQKGATDMLTAAAPAAAPTASADVDLIRRLKAGDEEAYAIVVRTLGGRMLSVARRFLQDEELARDAVQDAFLSAFRSMHTFDGDAQLSTWLHRIVVNASLMKLRTRRRKPEQSIEPMLPAFAEDGHHATRPVVAWTDSAEEALLKRETRARVRAAIAGLPESYRTVLLLRDIEERSTREAADLLGITENALKLRLHRARQALATTLKAGAVA
jgi:RNA polymerase sigma-70 factor (ECF subfamily)